jgi:hypothetical protein
MILGNSKHETVMASPVAEVGVGKEGREGREAHDTGEFWLLHFDPEPCQEGKMQGLLLR